MNGTYRIYFALLICFLTFSSEAIQLSKMADFSSALREEMKTLDPEEFIKIAEELRNKLSLEIEATPSSGRDLLFFKKLWDKVEEKFKDIIEDLGEVFDVDDFDPILNSMEVEEFFFSSFFFFFFYALSFSFLDPSNHLR